jgi:hypothetical protein
MPNQAACQPEGLRHGDWQFNGSPASQRPLVAGGTQASKIPFIDVSYHQSSDRHSKVHGLKTRSLSSIRFPSGRASQVQDPPGPVLTGGSHSAHRRRRIQSCMKSKDSKHCIQHSDFSRIFASVLSIGGLCVKERTDFATASARFTS